jgi:hypothetical protein
LKSKPMNLPPGSDVSVSMAETFGFRRRRPH